MHKNTAIIKSVKVGKGKTINPNAFKGKTLSDFKKVYSGYIPVDEAWRKVQVELDKEKPVKEEKPKAKKKAEKPDIES